MPPKIRQPDAGRARWSDRRPHRRVEPTRQLRELPESVRSAKADVAEEHVEATALTALDRVAGTGELIDTVHTALEPRSHGAVSE